MLKTSTGCTEYDLSGTAPAARVANVCVDSNFRAEICAGKKMRREGAVGTEKFGGKLKFIAVQSSVSRNIRKLQQPYPEFPGESRATLAGR